MRNSGNNIRSNNPAQDEYRAFLFGVMAFLITDLLWGILDEYKLISVLYADTMIFFAVMMGTVLLWTRYVIAYLEDESPFGRALFYTGIILFALVITALIINLFTPLMFWFDENGAYHEGIARYITFIAQIVLFFLTFVYTISVTVSSQGSVKRRHLAIGAFGIAMVITTTLQLFYPLFPLYTIGNLIGICLIHSFVIEGEKEEYNKTLEEMLEREKQQMRELGFARRKIYTDPLTGVKSKQAYLDDIEKLDKRIKNGEEVEFGVVVFDMNDLKNINDKRGHDIGDIYIYNAGMLISEFFSKSPVYRIGGDEFAAILEGEDNDNRKTLVEEFDKQVESNMLTDKVVVASGLAEYNAEADREYREVFERADKRMYQKKRKLKQLKKKQRK